MSDVFAVQSDVAGRIASALKLTLQPEETQAISQAPTTDPLAYDLFLRAEYLANRGGVNRDTVPLKEALVPYRQAIARDPSFALALARLSNAQRSEEHTSELQSLMRISYAVFCLKKKKMTKRTHTRRPTDHNTPTH